MKAVLAILVLFAVSFSESIPECISSTCADSLYQAIRGKENKSETELIYVKTVDLKCREETEKFRSEIRGNRTKSVLLVLQSIGIMALAAITIVGVVQ